MTINESINTQAEINRLNKLIQSLGGTDPLREKYYKAELEFYKGLAGNNHRQGILNARQAEIERLKIDRKGWEARLISACPRELEKARERIEAIDKTIGYIEKSIEKSRGDIIRLL